MEVLGVEVVDFDLALPATAPDPYTGLVTALEGFEAPGQIRIEGHTDAVGNAAYNLALSDRRAESVALALTEYFDVPPENLVIQGYGEYDLKVPTEASEQENRRVAVRRITPLLNR